MPSRWILTTSRRPPPPAGLSTLCLSCTDLFPRSTVQIYYSLGSAALEAVIDVVSVDLSGMGQFQLGILKKPTGTSDVATSGYQETGLNEGQIYGGIFVEDSTGGCVSL